MDKDVLVAKLDQIIEGCRGVKEDPDMHDHAKELATLVIQDCLEILKGVEYV